MTFKIKNNISGSEFWVDSEFLNFPELEEQSFIPSKWSCYNKIGDDYDNKIIKPVNKYVLELYPKPEIIQKTNNKIVLRQKTHAEIWVEPLKRYSEETLYALDKCHQRQFYPSSFKIFSEECFLATYRFYMPWFPDLRTNIFFKNIEDEFSPFRIKDDAVVFYPPEKNDKYVNTCFIHFNIKKNGPHMKDDRYGIIDIGSPMYDMELKLDEDIIEKIANEYE